MNCGHKVSKNYDYTCILEPNHKGMHQYDIKGELHHIGGCCPDGQVVKYESR